MLSKILQFHSSVWSHWWHIINPFTYCKVSDLVFWRGVGFVVWHWKVIFLLPDVTPTPHLVLSVFPGYRARDATSMWWPMRPLSVEYTLFILMGGFIYDRKATLSACNYAKSPAVPETSPLPVRLMSPQVSSHRVGSLPLHIWEGDRESWLWCVPYSSADVPCLLPDGTLSPAPASSQRGVGQGEMEWGSTDRAELCLDTELQVSYWWKVTVLPYKNSIINLFF